MLVGTHYYVLSLGADSAVLYEAFRDHLILMENRGFPVVRTGPGTQDTRAHLRTVDRCLATHFDNQPLGLVLAGDPDQVHAFESESRHAGAIVGRLYADCAGMRIRDLGQVVWPIVKDELSGLLADARRQLEASARNGHDRPGLDSVAAAVTAGARGRLLVENGFHVRGSLSGTGAGARISPEVDIRDTDDDAVDAVIDRVRAMGDQVVFMPAGALRDLGRVVFLLREGGQ